MDPGALHAMNGDHALAGVRSRPESIRAWYERLFRLLPDVRFDVDAIAVSGPPWRTTVVVQWRDRALGGTYGNQGVNVVDLRWGRIQAIRIHCDSQRLAAQLAGLAADGVSEAADAPLTDPIQGTAWTPVRR
jgi:ketosteroid isomerase-like protein